jgi:DUF2911 family protein
MKALAVPLLAMGSWHDEGSPVASPPNISQWEEIKLLYPAIPLTVVAFDDTRAYISADAPEEFDRALADFLGGRPVHGKTGYSLPRTSSRASVMQAVGGAEIAIAYGRPAVRGRKVWGEAAWTLIFNRVPRQWGAFDYNPAFDSLRFTVTPAEAPHEEYLRYTIQPAGSNAAAVTLAWEKRAVRFRIDVP